MKNGGKHSICLLALFEDPLNGSAEHVRPGCSRERAPSGRAAIAVPRSTGAALSLLPFHCSSSAFSCPPSLPTLSAGATDVPDDVLRPLANPLSPSRGGWTTSSRWELNPASLQLCSLSSRAGSQCFPGTLLLFVSAAPATSASLAYPPPPLCWVAGELAFWEERGLLCPQRQRLPTPAGA